MALKLHQRKQGGGETLVGFTRIAVNFKFLLWFANFIKLT